MDDDTKVEEFASSRSAGSGATAPEVANPAPAAASAAPAAAPAPDAAQRPSTPRSETIAAQRREIEQLKATLADRDSQIKKLQSELAAGKAASPSAPDEPEKAQETGHGSSAPTGSAMATSPGAKPTSHAGMSQGGKGVGAKSGQVAQAAFTDYETLFDSAFAAVREITTNSQEIIKAGVAKDEAQLVIEMAQSALYPLDQMRTLFRESQAPSACRNGPTVGTPRHARSGRGCLRCPHENHATSGRAPPRPTLARCCHCATAPLTCSHLRLSRLRSQRKDHRS